MIRKGGTRGGGSSPTGLRKQSCVLVGPPFLTFKLFTQLLIIGQEP